LKLKYAAKSRFVSSCFREKSTKTRIETLEKNSVPNIQMRFREKSTKTRIETLQNIQYRKSPKDVLEKNPPKQGLKPPKTFSKI